MQSRLKIGALAAFAGAATYLFGFAVLLLIPPETATASATEKLAFILAHKTLYQYWILTIYVLFGVLLAFLVTALQQSKAVLSTVGTVFGYVWVVLVIASGMLASTGLETVATLFEARPKQATALWLSIEAMQNGLGGGVEIVGGLWVFLISLQAIRQRRPCPLVHGLGLLVGTLGILTVLPPLGYLAAAFGIGQIAWFVLIGLYLCKQASTLHKNSTQKPEGILVTR